MIIIITNFSPHVIHRMLCPCKKAQHFYFIVMIFMLLIVSYQKDLKITFKMTDACQKYKYKCNCDLFALASLLDSC